MTSLSKLSSSSTSTKDTTSAAQGEQCNEKYIRVWREEERMPIHIGKKFYKISMGDLSILDKVNEGDKVVLQVRIGEEQAAEKVFVDLKALQVEVELRHEGYRRQSAGKPAPSLQSTNAVDSNTGEAETDMNLIDPADGIDPLTVFRKFMTSGGYDEYLEAAIERPAATQTSALTSETELSSRTALYTKVFDEGISTLSRLQNAANATGAAIDTRVRNLSLEYVKLSDFGPYGGKEVTYPLGKRGIVLLTADSSDGTGADSNGAGKVIMLLIIYI